MIDNYIVVLLFGMITYKLLDMCVNQLKLSQCLQRFDRLVHPLFGQTAPRRATYRRIRRSTSVALARTIVKRHKTVARTHFFFVELMFLTLLFVVSIFLIGVQIVDHRVHGTYIVGTATIGVSIMTSAIAVVMESLRDSLERV